MLLPKEGYENQCRLSHHRKYISFRCSFEKVFIFFIMAAFEAKTNRKQISIILGLLKIDCNDLYKIFHANKTQLKHAIEVYEEFMTSEINTLFPNNNNFSEIVLNHRKKFEVFIDEATTKIFNDAVPYQNGTSGDNIDVLYITLQEWLTQGPKGQQFYFMIDINFFKFSEKQNNINNGSATFKVYESHTHKSYETKTACIFYFTGKRY